MHKSKHVSDRAKKMIIVNQIRTGVCSHCGTFKFPAVCDVVTPDQDQGVPLGQDDLWEQLVVGRGRPIGRGQLPHSESNTKVLGEGNYKIFQKK